jgi:hypothetical protein
LMEGCPSNFVRLSMCPPVWVWPATSCADYGWAGLLQPPSRRLRERPNRLPERLHAVP